MSVLAGVSTAERSAANRLAVKGGAEKLLRTEPGAHTPGDHVVNAEKPR